jgi:GNAT superfamily N-acetyltransferase
MIFRTATIDDIPQIQVVRNSVHENTLSDPNLVSNEDCEIFLTIKGKGWICDIDEQIVGFAIVDLSENNIWALFLDPRFEGKGIARKLQQLMLDWYFSQTQTTVWLGTTPNTRAEQFYRKTRWVEAGMNGTDEIKFEMSYETWINK